MMGRWPQLVLKKDGDQYLLSDVDMVDGYLRCYWTKDRSNDYMNNKIGRLGKIEAEQKINLINGALGWYRNHLIDSGRFTSDQLVLVG